MPDLAESNLTRNSSPPPRLFRRQTSGIGGNGMLARAAMRARPHSAETMVVCLPLGLQLGKLWQ